MQNSQVIESLLTHWVAQVCFQATQWWEAAFDQKVERDQYIAGPPNPKVGEDLSTPVPVVVALMATPTSYSGVNPAGDKRNTSRRPPNVEWGGTEMHYVPPNMAEISLHKRQRIRLYLLNCVIVLFLSNISCLQLCQMFYRGELCELYFQILDRKQCRRHPKFPIRFTPLPPAL